LTTEKSPFTPEKKPRKFRWLRRIIRVILSIIIFLLLLILFIRSPWGQDIIVQQVVSYIEDKTGTEVQVDKLFLTFSGDLKLEGVYLEDKAGDTLIYSRSLEADLPLGRIISGQGIGVEQLDWDGLKARIKRQDTVNGFNFAFLQEAFATTATDTTQSAPLNLSIGNVNLTDFDILYDDAFTGITATSVFKQLDLSMDRIDLDAMIYAVDQLQLQDATINVVMNTPANSPPENDEITTDTDASNEALGRMLPLLSADNVSLSQINFKFKMPEQGLDMSGDISQLNSKLDKIDLQDQIYKISDFELVNSAFDIRMQQDASTTTNQVNEPFNFEWPALNVDLQNTTIRNTDLLYVVNDAEIISGQFNPKAIELTDLNMESSQINYADQQADFAIETLNGKEGSGIVLHELELDGKVTDQQLAINGLQLKVNENRLNGNVKLTYNSINQLVNQPENLAVSFNLPTFYIDIADAFRFQPDLRNNEIVAGLAKNPVRGNLMVTGTTDQLQIPAFKLSWGSDTRIYASGTMSQVTNVDKLTYNFNDVALSSTRNDLSLIVSENDLGVQLPDQVQFTGDFKGTTTALETNSQLKTSLGNVDVVGDFAFGDEIKFDTNLKAININLAQILQNPSLGNLTIQVDAQGSGSSLNTLDAHLESTIIDFSYNDYAIKNVPVSGNFANGKGSVNTSFKDENLNMELASQIELDSTEIAAQVDFKVIGVDLQAFGISSRDVRAAGALNATFTGNTTNYKVTSHIEDGIAVYDQQSYLLGALDIDAFVQPDTTSVDLSNRMIDLKLRSNTDPSQLLAGLRRHIGRYLTDEVVTDSIRDVEMSVNGTISPSPMLRDVILPQLEALDTIQIAVDFNEADRRLKTDIVIPYLKYAGSEIDSLQLSSWSDRERFDFQFGFNQLSTGPILLKRTSLDGYIENNNLRLDLLSFDGNEKLLHIGSTLSRKRDPQGVENLVWSLSPEDLILNRENWQIPEDNAIIFGKERTRFNNFLLSNRNQLLQITDLVSENQKNQVAMALENFKLQSILSLINPDEKIASGKVTGDLVIENDSGKMGFTANLTVDELTAMQIPLGTLALKGNSAAGDTYNMDMTLKGEGVDLGVNGSYVASAGDAGLDLNVAVDRLSMKTLAGLSNDFLKDGSGYLTANFKLGGTTLEPIYDGRMSFKDAAINVSMLDNTFTMRDEQISLNNDGISMDNFEIRDQDNNLFAIAGSIGTEEILTPTFDLQVDADNFTVLNSTAADNDLYYGKAILDATATITGDINVPVIDMSISVDDSTNVTYVMPASEVDIVEREGVVQFVNKENPDAILTQTDEETAQLSGYDINAAFKIGAGAVVNVIVDPNTGDNLQVSGDGDLRFTMNPNGRMTLTGRYEINDGYYQLNFYDIVSRRFELAQGGSVSWSGDPYDAALDITAIYQVETSASALMESQTSGADASTKNKFKQRLPFLVNLNVDGSIMSPEISFALDLPEEEQGAISGQVYGRIQQLNTQEQELNKQVFSLVTFNRFFPSSGSDGSSGGTASIARDNLNQALSDQLNQYGEKLLGNTGVDLDFGLDSYTDYQGNGSQNRTQLDVTASKKLLDDRLIISVGSEVDIEGSAAEGESTPIIGNVALEYLLTPSGRWRLKGFRKNQFDNVVDGQLVVSGVALIFTREFNKFKNIFNTVKEKEEKARKEEEEEKLKNNQAKTNADQPDETDPKTKKKNN
jgi:hypothetical protein